MISTFHSQLELFTLSSSSTAAEGITHQYLSITQFIPLEDSFVSYIRPLSCVFVPAPATPDISGDLILLRFSLFRCFTCTGETPLCHFSPAPHQHHHPFIPKMCVSIHTQTATGTLLGLCVFCSEPIFVLESPKLTPTME